MRGITKKGTQLPSYSSVFCIVKVTKSPGLMLKASLISLGTATLPNSCIFTVKVTANRRYLFLDSGGLFKPLCYAVSL